jgi:hypothetical protein
LICKQQQQQQQQHTNNSHISLSLWAGNGIRNWTSILDAPLFFFFIFFCCKGQNVVGELPVTLVVAVYYLYDEEKKGPSCFLARGCTFPIHTESGGTRRPTPATAAAAAAAI